MLRIPKLLGLAHLSLETVFPTVPCDTGEDDEPIPAEELPSSPHPDTETKIIIDRIAASKHFARFIITTPQILNFAPILPQTYIIYKKNKSGEVKKWNANKQQSASRLI